MLRREAIIAFDGMGESAARSLLCWLLRWLTLLRSEIKAQKKDCDDKHRRSDCWAHSFLHGMVSALPPRRHVSESLLPWLRGGEAGENGMRKRRLHDLWLGVGRIDEDWLGGCDELAWWLLKVVEGS